MDTRPAPQAAGKFIILDPTLIHVGGGHHWDYNAGVAEAALRQGWQPIIFGHRRLAGEFPREQVLVRRHFSMTWTGQRPRSALRERISWLARRLRRGPRRLARWVLTCLWASFLLVARDGRLENRVHDGARKEWRALKRRAKRVLSWGRVLRFIPFLRPLAKAVLAMPGILLGGIRRRGRAVRWQPFRAELERALKVAGAGPNDLAFVHTLGVEQLEQILSFLRTARRDRLPRFHILLRRDAHEPLTTNAAGIGLRHCLRQFHASGLCPGHVAFYTDTDHLTRQYNELSAVPFVTAPIPGNYARLRAAEPCIPRDDRPGLRVAYLGDARTEKGYSLLPDLVQALWSSHAAPGRLHFVFQSHFNMPGGEPGMCEVRRSLAQYPERAVELLRDPLSSRQYRELLRSADIVVIPYNEQDYRARSSGVLVDALGAGKPVVVPAGTWMADQIGETLGIACRDAGEMAAAVAKIAEDYPRFSAAAQEHALLWRMRHSPQALVKCLLQRQDELVPSAAESDAPSVLFLFPTSCPSLQTLGNAKVARSQLEYLSRCGYRIYVVVFVVDFGYYACDRQRWERELHDALAEFNIAGLWALHIKTTPANFLRHVKTVRNLLAGRATLERDVALYRLFPVPRSLRNFVRRRPPSMVYANYAFSLEYVRRLRLDPAVPVVCEMLDIQAHQHAIANRTDVDPREVAKECALLDRCASVVAINTIEAEAVRPMLRRAKVVCATPAVVQKPLTVGQLAGCRDVAEVLAASGGDLPGAASQDILPALRDQLARAGQPAQLDLLYVSSYHVPNIRSFEWFYSKVYLPLLAERGVTMAVAGTVCQDIWDRKFGHRNLWIMGRVRQLGPLYAACRLVVLPMRQGAGTNIKALEALGLGKPIVSTGFGLRGLENGEVRLPACDTPEAFAAEVLRLLGDESARLEAMFRGQELLGLQQRQDLYDDAIHDALRQALGERAIPPPRRTLPPGPVRLVEWGPAIQAFNSLLRDFVEDRSAARSDVAAVSEALQHPETREDYQALYQTFATARTAPILDVLPGLRAAVAERFPVQLGFDEFLAASLEGQRGGGDGCLRVEDLRRTEDRHGCPQRQAVA